MSGGQHASHGVFTRYQHDFHSEMNRKLTPRLHRTAFMQSRDLSGNEKVHELNIQKAEFTVGRMKNLSTQRYFSDVDIDIF